MDWIFPRTCLPRLPDAAPGLGHRLAGQVAQLRYHRLRMPAGLLMRHLAHKAWAAVPTRRSSAGVDA
jgi:hypothetical protein